MSTLVFPPLDSTPALAKAIADSLTGDWALVSDGRGYTGQVLHEIIGSDFDEYRRLKTLQAVADDPAASAVATANADAALVIAGSPSGLPIFAGSLPAGIPAFGGFLGPLMDSSQAGAIPGNDKSTTPQRYRLIDLGRAAEASASLAWKTSNDAGPVATNTVWNGLAATQAMISAGAAYPAAQYAAGFTVPTDGASAAYIPSIWEMLAMYWLFKPFTNNNYLTATAGSTFPGGTVTQGLDPASDPQRPAFTASVPGQTSLAAWRTGGAQAFQNDYYWTSTEYSAADAWFFGWTTGGPGWLGSTTKSGTCPVRLVRRFVL